MSVKGIIMFLGMNNTRLERKVLIILDFENGFLPTYLPQWTGSLGQKRKSAHIGINALSFLWHIREHIHWTDFWTLWNSFVTSSLMNWTIVRCRICSNDSREAIFHVTRSFLHPIHLISSSEWESSELIYRVVSQNSHQVKGEHLIYWTSSDFAEFDRGQL